jgi:P-type Ca2+ transporter type 2C
LPVTSNDLKKTWYQKDIVEVESVLSTNLKNGLTQAQSTEKIKEYGKNEIVETGGRSPVKIILEQLLSTMVLILIAACIISAFLGDLTEVIAIVAIVVLFVVLGFVQEYKAEKAMAALKKMSVPLIRAIRDGKEVEISATELVPGDLIILETGNIVPADARVVEAVNLKIQESALTGESEAVDKGAEVIITPNAPVGDRINMIHMGTIVTYGRGKAVVTDTGMKTELGKIATLIQNVKPGLTPLQRQLDLVGKQLAVAGILVAIIVVIIGLFEGGTLEQLLLTAVSVAVAVVPEGLPAVVTITLALGAQRMLKRHALIRKLPAVETLGSVNVICSDKTGTLTKNLMTATIVDVVGHTFDLTMEKHDPERIADNVVDLFENHSPSLGLTLIGGALCNDASIKSKDDDGKVAFHGDPTEGALLVAAEDSGLLKNELENHLPRVAELPFESSRKRMTTVHETKASTEIIAKELKKLSIHDSKYLAFTKGSVDGLLEVSTQVLTETGIVKLDNAWKRRIEKSNNDLASKGIRVLGIALRNLNSIENVNFEEELIFIGLFGMIDPPRPEVKEAVAKCKTAGIRPIMITGDHPLTASYIAKDLGIADNNIVMTGVELEGINDTQLKKTVRTVSVYARVAPEHKLRIVNALQEQHNVVGMTGDGVNDSPALKKADIGIAMGITGTDVSKEASEMVLLDDNFATIVASAEEGRVIYDNIKRFISFSVAGNLGKVIVMLAAPLFGAIVALFPLQLLWLNLLTDGLLGLGLGVEVAEKGVMNRSPRPLHEKVFNKVSGIRISWIGVLLGLITLVIGGVYYTAEVGDKWQTMMFTALAFLQIGQAFGSRSNTESLFSMRFFSNPLLIWMVVLTVILQLVVLFIPYLANIFRVVPLNGLDLFVCVVAGFILFFAIEIEKKIKRKSK